MTQKIIQFINIPKFTHHKSSKLQGTKTFKKV